VACPSSPKGMNIHTFVLVPMRRVGMQSGRAAFRFAPQRGYTAFPRSAWERENFAKVRQLEQLFAGNLIYRSKQC